MQDPPAQTTHVSQTEKNGHAQYENNSKIGVGKKGIPSYLFKLKM